MSACSWCGIEGGVIYGGASVVLILGILLYCLIREGRM